MPPAQGNLSLLAAALVLTTLAANASSEVLLHQHGFVYPTLLSLSAPLLTVATSALASARGGCVRRAPLRSHVISGAIVFVSTWSGARAQVSLPAAIFMAAKSARLVATMAVGALWMRKSYAVRDWLAALLAMAGLALTLSGSSEVPLASSGVEATGAALVTLSLLADGIFSTYQEQIIWQWGAGTLEVATWSHGTAAALMALYAAAQGGDTTAGLAIAAREPAIAGWLALLALSGYCSTLLVLAIVSKWGTARASFALTVAKALSVGGALLTARGDLQRGQLLGVALVLASILTSCAQPQALRARGSPRGDSQIAPALTNSSSSAAAAQVSSSGAGLRQRRRSRSRAPPVPSPARGSPPAPSRTPSPARGSPLGLSREPPAAWEARAAGAAPAPLPPSLSPRVPSPARLPPPGASSPAAAGTASPSPLPPAASPPRGAPSPLSAASSGALRRIASASRLTLDALSAAGGLQRPARIFDTLSPGPARPEVVPHAAARIFFDALSPGPTRPEVVPQPRAESGSLLPLLPREAAAAEALGAAQGGMGATVGASPMSVRPRLVLPDSPEEAPPALRRSPRTLGTVRTGCST